MSSSSLSCGITSHCKWQILYSLRLRIPTSSYIGLSSKSPTERTTIRNCLSFGEYVSHVGLKDKKHFTCYARIPNCRRHSNVPLFCQPLGNLQQGELPIVQCLLIMNCVFEVHVKHKKLRHCVYAIYVKITNTIDIERLSQKVENVFSTSLNQISVQMGISTLYL